VRQVRGARQHGTRSSRHIGAGSQRGTQPAGGVQGCRCAGALSAAHATHAHAHRRSPAHVCARPVAARVAAAPAVVVCKCARVCAHVCACVRVCMQSGTSRHTHGRQCGPRHTVGCPCACGQHGLPMRMPAARGGGCMHPREPSARQQGAGMQHPGTARATHRRRRPQAPSPQSTAPWRHAGRAARACPAAGSAPGRGQRRHAAQAAGAAAARGPPEVRGLCAAGRRGRHMHALACCPRAALTRWRGSSWSNVQ
jgi:hypothetical protein